MFLREKEVIIGVGGMLFFWVLLFVFEMGM